MAVTLVGEVINTADSITGFNTGNISTDDDQVQGAGAIGLKTVTGLSEIYTTSLGATAPYGFASGNTEFGNHIIMWFNTKTPINAANGLQIIVGDGTNRGRWDVTPAGFYKGGFTTAVVNPAQAFNNISAGSWTTGGNPGQLSNVTQVGGGFVTLTSIMGNFNNVQLDQFTVGLGLRADAGTVGVPNKFETVRAVDEDTNFWGWWSSRNGAIVGKGKLYIGPATGTATSVFTDSAFSVIFPNERVATGFYEINTRGANTTIRTELGSIAAANSAAARWGLTIQSDTKSFDDVNSVWKGAGAISLNANTRLTGTTLIDCQSVALNGATANSISVLSSNAAANVALITASTLNNIQNSSFDGTGVNGHAINITANGTYSFSGNIFTGYNAANNTANSAILNSAGGLVTINISGGGSSPTVRNTAGSSTVINNTVTFSVTNIPANAEVRLFRNSDQVELAGVERINDTTPSNATVSADPDNTGRFRLSYSHQESSLALYVVVIEFASQVYYQNFTITNTQAEQSLLVSLIPDRQYSNPT